MEYGFGDSRNTTLPYSRLWHFDKANVDALDEFLDVIGLRIACAEIRRGNDDACRKL